MLKLSKLFGDHAVLQRNRTIVVWGWCDPFTSVSGTLGTATAAARSGGDGRFTLRFPALPAGGHDISLVFCKIPASGVHDA